MIGGVALEPLLSMDPFEATRRLTARAHQVAEALTKHLAEWDLDDWTTTKLLPGGGAEPITHPMIRLWLEACAEARKAAAALTSLELDAVALRLEAARVAVLADAFRKACTAVDIPGDQAAALAAAFRAQIEVSGG